MPELLIPSSPPRSYQRKVWEYMQGDGGFETKRAVMVWHRRAGKDETAMQMTAWAALHDRPAVYWHMLPEAEQARKAIWRAVNPHTGMRRIDEVFPLQIRKKTRDQEMMIEFVNGSVWQLVGSDNFNSLVGAGPKGVVFSEYSLANPLAWAFLRPMLLENRGWAVFVYTPRGKNHGHTLYEDALKDPLWFAQKLTAYETGIFTPETLERERLEYRRQLGDDDGDAKFRQEYLCDFAAANVGAYYAREFEAIDREGRISTIPYDPDYPVHTSWDIGYHDSTAIWFAQKKGERIHLIDYEQGTGMTMDYWAKKVLDRPYAYASHIFPHDASNGDVFVGKRVEVIRKLFAGRAGFLRFLTNAECSVQEGIQAARRLLTKSVFDGQKCAEGVEALQAYRKDWDDDRRMFSPKPYHDWSSHGADSFRYLAVGLPESLGLKERNPVVDKYRETREGRAARSARRGGRWT